MRRAGHKSWCSRRRGPWLCGGLLALALGCGVVEDPSYIDPNAGAPLRPRTRVDVWGHVMPPICPDADGTCSGPAYALELGGASLFADPECPTELVSLTFTQCQGRLHVGLISCPPAEVAEQRSCVWLDVDDAYRVPRGGGVYFDAAGASYDVVVDVLDLGLEDLDAATLRAGVVRGSFAQSGDGSSQPFELSFRACSHEAQYCLL